MASCVAGGWASSVSHAVTLSIQVDMIPFLKNVTECGTKNSHREPLPHTLQEEI